MSKDRNRNLKRRPEMTTRQVCDYLRMSRMTLHRRRKAGLLVPKRRDDSGALLYCRQAVEAYERDYQRHKRTRQPAPRDGSVAAEAYKMFEQGRSDQEVVMTMRLHPREVEALREQYTAPNELRLSPRHRRRIERALARHGMRHVRTPKQLVDMVIELLKTNATLNRALLLAQDDNGEDAA